VGKSSLINTLLNRKRLVKTSSTPGRTQLINFFDINSAFYFVDLPGYGYARVPEAVKKRWGPMVEKYLTTRKTLKSVLLIMDLRRIPGEEEQNFIEWLDFFKISFIPVLTKSDKLSKTKQRTQRDRIANSLSLDINDFTLFSAKTSQGKDRIWAQIKARL
jgi:GTP-binding protein